MREDTKANQLHLPDAERRRERDFVSFFNALWYRDFPILRNHDDISANRSMWTTHVASIVKQCADLMGFFVQFEKGNRIDGRILKLDSERQFWANIEWEWNQAHNGKSESQTFNEVQKLLDASPEADVSILIGYSEIELTKKYIEFVRSRWKSNDKLLYIFLITFEKITTKNRKFSTLQTYRIFNGIPRKLREQHALPWDVPNSRWKAMAEIPAIKK